MPASAAAGRPRRPRGRAAETLQGQWLLVVVAGGACDAVCERHLWLQRQLRETLGREKDRVDKLWLIDDAAAPRSRDAGGDRRRPGAAAPVTRPPCCASPRERSPPGCEPAAGRALEDHLYIVDPRGDWMMRVPAEADPARLKRDVERLLRASAGLGPAGPMSDPARPATTWRRCSASPRSASAIALAPLAWFWLAAPARGAGGRGCARWPC